MQGLGILFIIFAVIVVVAIIFAVVFVGVKFGGEVYRPQSKGERGEKAVAEILGETIVGKQYVINDLLFETESGKSCQIDHVLINKFGIWVIETKNLSGHIYGEENQREWTQVLAFGNEMKKFYNPIKQNNTHIFHLSRFLKVRNIFQNVVVFLSNANVSTIQSNSVYSIYELETIINQNTNISLSVEKMEYYYNCLLTLKENSTVSKEEHIANIHKMQAEVQHGICPRCGGRLVLRNGKYNQFFGCSNFPKCKFTKNIE